MKIAVLGTGTVGRAIAGKLVALGHDVKMGSRTPSNEKAADWVKRAGEVMVNPARVPGEHDVFVCGNDAAAKTRVTEILRDWFGWRSIVDLGDLTAARGMEAYVIFWVRLWGAARTPDFNIKFVR